MKTPKYLIPSLSEKKRGFLSKIILLGWGIYMLIIVPINHFFFPAWYHGDMGIPFGDSFDLWAVWLIGGYSIGLGIACFIAAKDPFRYYATVMEIIFGTLVMAIVCIASVYLLGTDPLRWTTWLTSVLLIFFSIAIILIYPLTPVQYSKNNA